MLEKFDIRNKKFLITGVTSGIGLEMARGFMGAGAHVIGIGRNTEKLNALKTEFGDSFEGLSIDLSRVDELELELKSCFVDEVDGFVHAAGIIYRRPIKLITSETFSEIMNVNVISGGLIAKFLWKSKLIRSAGSLVYISSVASNYAAIGNTMYMSSKGAVNSMVRGLALEMAKSQVRVNCIEPGLIQTHLTEGISVDEIANTLGNYPLGRLGEAIDVVLATQFLLSDASSWMTGQSLRVDGGLTLK